MNEHELTEIAPDKTTADWQTLCPRLVNGEQQAWAEAVDDYFLARLRSRYLDPIKFIHGHGKQCGEGFAMLTIMCSLIEFLESTAQGKNYRYLEPGQQLDKSKEYSKSRDIFVSFLTKRAPFKSTFDKSLARGFYTGVRCALLHEARTKDGWKIHATSKGGPPVDPDQKIVYRDEFLRDLEGFIDSHAADLRTGGKFRKELVRKFDALCEDGGTGQEEI